MPSNEKNSITVLKDNIIIWLPMVMAVVGYLIAIEPRLVLLEDHDIVTKSHNSRIISLEEFKSRGARFTDSDAEKAFSKLQEEQNFLNNELSKTRSTVARNEAKLDLIINKLEK